MLDFVWQTSVKHYRLRNIMSVHHVQENDEQCPVCTETYNRQKRKALTCVSCNYTCCVRCIEIFLQTSKSSPQCMNCHKIFDQEYIRKNINPSCLARILNNQKQILFNEQKALFPYTQEFIQLANEKQKLHDILKEKHKIIVQMKREYAHLYHRKNEIDRTMYNYTRDRSCSSSTTSSADDPTNGKKSKVYIQACSQPECNGFIDNTFVCGLCSVKFCKKCMNEERDDHVCKEDDVLSVQAIKNDSKPCPNCSTMIFRISGCPDMFCVSCHTTFNWNTLRVDSNGNSNPLYYQWLRENTGLPVDQTNRRCGRNPTMYQVFSASSYMKLPSDKKNSVSDIFNSLHHTVRNYQSYQQRGYTVNNSDSFETLTLQVRTKFLQNKIDEKNFKIQLMKLQKLKEYNGHVLQIRNVVNAFMLDMMHYVIHDENFSFDTFKSEYLVFSKYINQCIDDLRQLFYASRSKVVDRFISIPTSIQ